MREIRFQLIDKDGKIVGQEDHANGQIFHTAIVNGEQNGGGDIMWSKSLFIPHQFKRQYTGFKDKNGIEIYEGDICRHRTINDDGDFEDEWQNLTVRFSKGQFMTDYYGFPLHSFAERPKQAEIEIIGNIYETPKLLKV